jgi:DNA-binding beta-propeller fold protein YncE
MAARPSHLIRAALAAAIMVLPGCAGTAPGTSLRQGDDLSGQPRRLPTGAMLDPAGALSDVGQFPQNILPTPEGDRVVLVLNGYRDQGIQVVDPATGQAVQTLLQPAAFIGARFDHAGRQLFVSGGNQDVVYRYAWREGRAALADSLVLAAKPPRQDGTRYPAGLALSRDDRYLYVAENLSDWLAVVEVATGRVVQRLPAGRYPYAVETAPDGMVYVSAWGGTAVRSFRPAADGLVPAATIRVGRHPSAMLLNGDGSRLYVASASTDRVSVVDTRAGQVMGELVDTVPGGTGEGSTPNALALSADGSRLYVAEADNNAVAVFALGPGGAATGSRLLGRIPAGWYPAALLEHHDTLLVANGKGRGSAPNALNGPGPGRGRGTGGYVFDQMAATLSRIPLAGTDSAAFAQWSARVARANGWAPAAAGPAYPPFTHVIYVIKENRTYDQVFGDLRQGDGDSALVFFPRATSPNHHALAERFGLFDRFLTNAEVSGQGHNWSTAAYTTDYTEKTIQQNYGGRGREYDYEGTNRGLRPPEGDDVAEPAQGYLWDLARRRGITFRNFGEFVTEARADREGAPPGYLGLKPFLDAHTDSTFPGFNLKIPDQRRADIWLSRLDGWQRDGAMPALQIIRLPNDHTSGARAGDPTPRAFMADNDLALGRMIEGLSKSAFWRNTVVFVVEDDAQNGPDHVDSHRAPFLMISAWNRPGEVHHRFANTTDVLETIEEILDLQHLSQFDAFGRPLRGLFAGTPDLTPYTALLPATPMDERNPARGPGEEESAGFDFRFEDRVDDAAFNRVLWAAIKGPDRPYPGSRALTAPGAPR